MYADDKVLYVCHESKEKIENDLNQDKQMMSLMVNQDELVINLKKGKTETPLLGTTKRLKTAGKIDVLYGKQRIRLLERMRRYLTSKAVRLVYNTMIIPLLTSSCTLKSP